MPLLLILLQKEVVILYSRKSFDEFLELFEVYGYWRYYLSRMIKCVILLNNFVK